MTDEEKAVEAYVQRKALELLQIMPQGDLFMQRRICAALAGAREALSEVWGYQVPDRRGERPGGLPNGNEGLSVVPFRSRGPSSS